MEVVDGRGITINSLCLTRACTGTYGDILLDTWEIALYYTKNLTALGEIFICSYSYGYICEKPASTW